MNAMHTIGHQFHSQLFSFSLQLFCSVFVYFPFCNHWLFIWVTFQCVFSLSSSLTHSICLSFPLSMCASVCVYAYSHSSWQIFFPFCFLPYKMYICVYILVYCYRLCLAIFKPLRWRFRLNLAGESLLYSCQEEKCSSIPFIPVSYTPCVVNFDTQMFSMAYCRPLVADAVSWMNPRCCCCCCYCAVSTLEFVFVSESMSMYCC